LLFFTARVVDELNYEAIDKVCEAIQQVIDNDYGKLRKQQDSVTEVGAVLFLANKATNINAAVGTEDGGIILRSVHELVYGVCWLASIYSFNVGDIMDSNIRKLKVRYPDKFSKDKALNRDLEAEMKAVKGEEDGKDTN
jgi:ribosome-associated translation inhibitor RaiA